MDVAAEVIGFRIMRTKLTAFAVSSFYSGVAGAVRPLLTSAPMEPEAYNLDVSFRIPFMVIIGGVGSILGSFLGSLYRVASHRFVGHRALHRPAQLSVTSNLELMVSGRADHLLPDCRTTRPTPALANRKKVRLWPFPH